MDTIELRAKMLAAVLAQGIPMDQAIRDAEAAVVYVTEGPPKEVPPALPKRGPSRTTMILDMWAAGATAKQIAERFGMTSGTIYNAVNSARQRGDARAVLRGNHTEATRAAVATRMREIGRARRRTA